VSEEENLPSAEEMRARYADLMKDDARAADAAAVETAEVTEPEPEAAPADDDTLPSPDEMRARYADLMKDDAPASDAVPTSDIPTPDAPAVEPEDETPDPSGDLAAHLLDVNVRLWAELGRARLPLA
jgi:flagellar motor switch/type III secretory pathway protein FliN